jgi:hypothetical protein
MYVVITSVAEPEPVERQFFVGAGADMFRPAQAMKIRKKCYKNHTGTFFKKNFKFT